MESSALATCTSFSVIGSRCCGDEEEIQCVTNLLELEVSQPRTVYRYDVTISLHFQRSEHERQMNNKRFNDSRTDSIAVLQHIKSRDPEHFIGDFFYDGVKTLFSFHEFLEKKWDVRPSDVPIVGFQLAQLEVYVKPSSDNFKTDDLSNKEALLEFIRVLLNLYTVSSREQLFFQYGLYFREDDRDDIILSGGYILKPGIRFYTCVLGRQGEPKLYLAGEVEWHMFHKVQCLRDKYLELLETPDVVPERVLLDLSVVLKGEVFVPTYFVVNKLDAPANQFITCGNRSFQEYFRNDMNYEIKYPDLPLVARWNERNGKFCHYPMELLHVNSTQMVLREQMSKEGEELLIRMKKTNYVDRELYYKRLMDAVGLVGSSKLFADAGFTVNQNFLMVKARPIPGIAERKLWLGEISKFSHPPNLGEWAVVTAGVGLLPCRKFIRILTDDLRSKGADVKNPTILPFNEKTEPWEILFKRLSEKRITFALIILNDEDFSRDNIKYLELKSGIATQITRSSVAIKFIQKTEENEENLRETLNSITLKMCLRNGGVPCNAESASPILKIETDDVVYIGFEIFDLFKPLHEEHDRQKYPSRVGYAATCAKNPRRVVGGYIFITPNDRMEIYECVRGLVQSCMDTFFRNRGVLPKTMVLYLHAKMHSNRHAEIVKSIIQLAAKAVFEGPLLIIVTSKRTMERILEIQADCVGAGGRGDNALVIEEGMTSPYYHEFFLIPNLAFNARQIPKFTVFLNEPGYDLVTIEQTTYALCFLHEDLSLSLPAVLTIAARQCYMADTMLKYHVRKEQLSRMSATDANAVLRKSK